MSEALSFFKKMNPFPVIILVFLATVISRLIFSRTEIIEQIALFLYMTAFLMIVSSFEIRRIEQKEQNSRRIVID